MFEAKPSDPCVEIRPELPHLFRSLLTKQVVLFSDEDKGVLLHPGTRCAEVTGETEDD